MGGWRVGAQRGDEDGAADICRGLLPTLIERIDSMYEDESIAVLQLFACVVEMHDKQVPQRGPYCRVCSCACKHACTCKSADAWEA